MADTEHGGCDLVGWRDKVSGVAALEQIMAEQDGKGKPARPKPVAEGNRIIVPGQDRPAGAPPMRGPPINPQLGAWLQANGKGLLLVPAPQLEVHAMGMALMLPKVHAQAMVKLYELVLKHFKDPKQLDEIMDMWVHVHRHMASGGAVQCVPAPAKPVKPDCADGAQRPAGVPARKPDCAAGQQQPAEAMVKAQEPAAAGKEDGE